MPSAKELIRRALTWANLDYRLIPWYQYVKFRLDPQPSDYVEQFFHRNLRTYLGRENVDDIVVVGSYLGYEVELYRRIYPKSRIVCFEPNPDTFRRLSRRFRSDARIVPRPYAVLDLRGEVLFYENDAVGTGSILRAKEGNPNRIAPRSMLTVEAVPLDDDEAVAVCNRIGFMSIDVQGAELRALKGAERTLARTDSVLLEFAVHDALYEGSSSWGDVERFLKEQGFICILLGADRVTFSGNSIWLKQELIQQQLRSFPRAASRPR